jgi:predicted deacetylase
MDARLLVSLHDVSPRHGRAVESILGHLERLGLPPVPLLVVPDFHGKWRLSEHPAFLDRLRAWSSKGHELCLHGFFHLERSEDASAASGPGAILRRRLLTAGEGEFLSLAPDRARARLEAGLAEWDACGLGSRPRGFVPPAWLRRPDLPEVLWSMGFSWTEDHHHVLFREAPALRSPVITWASRDPVRRIGSRFFAPAALRAWNSRDVLRVAIHPHDWDHPALVRSISGTIAGALGRRRPVQRPEDLLRRE